jgi:hypothetical protein
MCVENRVRQHRCALWGGGGPGLATAGTFSKQHHYVPMTMLIPSTSPTGRDVSKIVKGAGGRGVHIDCLKPLESSISLLSCYTISIYIGNATLVVSGHVFV